MQIYNKIENILEEYEYSYKPDAWNPILSDMDDWFQDPLETDFVSDLVDNLDDGCQSAVIRGMEVGDDRVDLSQHSERLRLELRVQSEILGMKTSQEDTSISNDLWNFTEVTGVLPAAKEESFDYVRKTGDTKNLGFLDCPRLRIILDTKKGNAQHSNSSVGKASMLSRDTYMSRDEIKENIQISSFLQDAFLQTVKMPDPKYLPRVMGGCGAGSPFGRPQNLYSYVKCFKHGTYERVYGTSTNELYAVISDLENGLAAEPWFSKRLREKQEYLHGTYAEKVFVPEQIRLTSPFWKVPLPIYQEAGTSGGISSVENRLVRAKRLIGNHAARVLVDQRDRIVQVLNGYITIESLDLKRKQENAAKRSRYEGALQANSAFQRLLSRCANDTDVSKLLSLESFRTINYGSLHFNMNHAEWLHNGAKGKVLSTYDIKESEDMYLYSELSLENTLRVSGIPLKTLFNKDNRPMKETVKKIGLYEISTSQESWADNICHELLNSARFFRPIPRNTILDIYAKDLEWVNDDSMIISKILHNNLGKSVTNLVILVSSDKKLARQIAKSSNMAVALYSPTDIIECLNRETWSSTSTITVDELMRFDPSLKKVILNQRPEVYIDSGSLMAAAVNYEQELNHRTNVKTVVLRKLINVERYPQRKATYIVTGLVPNVSKILRYNLIKPEIGKSRQSAFSRKHYSLSEVTSFDSTSDGLTMNTRALSWAISNL